LQQFAGRAPWIGNCSERADMHSLAWWPTIIVLLIATISDLRSRKIPNWLVFPFLAVGPVVSTVTHGWHGLGQSLLGILLAAIWMGTMYCVGGMGMGDVKLCAAIGAWIGPGQLFIALVVMAMAGGVMALVWSLCGGHLKESLHAAVRVLFRMQRHSALPNETATPASCKPRKMPYAPAIAVGTLFSFLAIGGPAAKPLGRDASAKPHVSKSEGRS
jgi:prepilin peptidase CpaA